MRKTAWRRDSIDVEGHDAFCRAGATSGMFSRQPAIRQALFASWEFISRRASSQRARGPRSRRASQPRARRSANMISARNIRALFQIRSDNPELVQSQLRVFASQVPLLYFMLLVNVVALSYTHLETAPRILTVVCSGLLALFCVVRISVWMWTGTRTLTHRPGRAPPQDHRCAVRSGDPAVPRLGRSRSIPTGTPTPKVRSRFSSRSP